VSSRRSSTTRGGVAPFGCVSHSGCPDFISGSVRCSAPNTYRDSLRREVVPVPRSRNSSVPSYRPPQAATCIRGGMGRLVPGSGEGQNIVGAVQLSWSGDGRPIKRRGSRDPAADELNRRFGLTRCGRVRRRARPSPSVFLVSCSGTSPGRRPGRASTYGRRRARACGPAPSAPCPCRVCGPAARSAGGFVLVLKYQLYPWTHRELARTVREDLGLPVDAPRALAEGTMERFVRWHRKRV
jgi:hypothetical protein